MSEEIKPFLVRLRDAVAAVDAVEKKGVNAKQNYKYVRAADVTNALRHELYSRDIIVLQNELECVNSGETKTNSGGVLREKTIKIQYTVQDVISPEKLVLDAYGVAMDTGDKAIYKAKTGALKYFLRGLGLIPDESDPEADTTVDEAVEFSPGDPDGLAGVFDGEPAKPVKQPEPHYATNAPMTRCPVCGSSRIQAAGISKAGKPYAAFCKQCADNRKKGQ